MFGPVWNDDNFFLDLLILIARNDWDREYRKFAVDVLSRGRITEAEKVECARLYYRIE